MKIRTKLNILPQTKFINCRKNVSLKAIAELAAQKRKFDNSISYDVESVEVVEREWTGRNYERLLKVWIFSNYAECIGHCFTQSLGEVA